MHRLNFKRNPIPLSKYILVLAIALIFNVASLPLNGQDSLPTAFSPKAKGNQLPRFTSIGGAASFEIQLDKLDNFSSPPVVTALTASADGRFIAAAGDDHAIRVIDSASGKTLHTILGHIDWIQALVFASEPDDKRSSVRRPVLYSAGNDGRILKWTNNFPIQSEELLRVPYAVRTLTISSQTNLLAIGGFSEEILVMDLESGLLKQKLNCRCGDQRCVTFSPSGNRLLCGGRDGTIHVWDCKTGEELAAYKSHTARIHTAAFSLDGNQVTSVAEDRRIVRFDIKTGQQVRARELGPSKMLSMCLLNEDAVAVAGADNTIRIYDAADDNLIATLKGHRGSVAVMTQCGRFLASGSFDTTVRIWNLESLPSPPKAAARSIPVRKPVIIDSQLQIR